eukprot:COSAG04_NODE_174_length_21563_cov_12.377003_8_plen_307_part_00
MAGLVDIGADAANNAEIEADMAASVLCDIWHLDGAKGALHLPHRGATLPWAELQRSGVQHFKMVLPDDASSYSWAADPELKEVRKLNQFEYGRLLKVVAEGGAAEGGEEEDRVAAAERAYFLSADEHTADLILFCVAGSAYVDVRHHPAGNGWVRVHLKDGDMLQIPEGCFYRWSLDESGQASVVALSTEPPSTETPALTPAAVAAYQKRHGGEEEPSRARYHYLHVRPKPRGWRSLFEPARDIGIPTPLSPVSRPFCARFAPVLRRVSAVILRCPASWRRDGENGRKMAENGRNLGEKRARNSGG